MQVEPMDSRLTYPASLQLKFIVDPEGTLSSDLASNPSLPESLIAYHGDSHPNASHGLAITVSTHRLSQLSKSMRRD
jgi:hypothetical protein